jgi:hypothetical protein
MKTIKGTMSCIERHYLVVEVPDDADEDECMGALCREFEANSCRKPDDYETELTLDDEPAPDTGVNSDLLALAQQYANDMFHPPSEDSRKRRLEWIVGVINKAEGRA